MVLFAATVFTSAFLLFLVQPIIAKQILPWFGGNASVWTVCMVFFQVLLLGGYAYADALSRRVSPRTQAIVHTALLAASLAFLPILAADGWKPDPDTDPAPRILALLTVTIGLPYFLLSTTGPLVQAWFARSFPAGTVYRLFALSNLASLLALVAYPPLIEPEVTLEWQSYAWSALYVVFAGLCAASAWSAARHTVSVSLPEISENESEKPPALSDYLLWLALSALGSLMLLAITSHITQNVASIPFLWIVPLILYLLSFILVFDVGGSRSRSGWYSRAWGLPLLFGLLGAMAYALYENLGVWNIRYTIALYCAGLFAACMFCHGELAAMRPAPRYLTRFYLMVSVGGAAGGLFVGLIAPRIFDLYIELPIALIACGALAALLTFRWAIGEPRRVAYAVPLVAVALTTTVTWYVVEYVNYVRGNALVMTRNFYGTLRVRESERGGDLKMTRSLIHGVINHGWQFVDPALRMQPISYFGPGSGIARALDYYGERPRRVGIVGLGVGVFTAWGRAGDYFRIYELDPDVVKIAREQFWYLSGTKAKFDVITGDGRLNLEREKEAQRFDLLSVDAFSSGSIPIHLLTREALRGYRRHLAPGGVIVYNVTNRFVNLAPLLKLVAEAEGMKILLIEDSPSDERYSGTSYVLVTENEALLADKRFADAEKIEPIPGLKPWTDGFNNLFKVVK
jgi:SAM-dependent methyltransferase